MEFVREMENDAKLTPNLEMYTTLIDIAGLAQKREDLTRYLANMRKQGEKPKESRREKRREREAEAAGEAEERRRKQADTRREEVEREGKNTRSRRGVEKEAFC